VYKWEKSDFMDNRGRSILEEPYLAPLKSGGLRRSMSITKQKLIELNIDKSKAIPESGMLKRLWKDGVYKDSATKMKFGSANIQRLEERLIRERPKTVGRSNWLFNYFKQNGELKLHHDLLAWQTTWLYDLSITENQ